MLTHGLKYRVGIYKKIIKTFTYFTKKDIRTRFHSSLDTGFNELLILSPINITWLRLRVVGFNRAIHAITVTRGCTTDRKSVV